MKPNFQFVFRCISYLIQLKKSYLPLFVSFFLFYSNSVNSQAPDFSNLTLPDELKGVIVQDLIKITVQTDQELKELIVVYSSLKILILDFSSANPLLHSIDVSTFSRNSELYRELDRIPSISYICYNEANMELYYVKPNLRLYKRVLQPDLSIGNEIALPAPSGLGNSLGMKGCPILKYDPVHHRIYYAVNGTGIENLNGYFGIFQRNTDGSFFEIDNMLITEDIDFYDVLFNERENSNVFYLSVDDYWEVWQIQSGQFERQLQISNGNPVKNGWFLPVRIGNTYTIYCLPHDDWNPPNATGNIIAINGDNQLYSAYPSPSSIIKSGCLIQVPGEHPYRLVLGVSPIGDGNSLHTYDAVTFTPLGSVRINDGFDEVSSDMSVTSNGAIILSRKDRITKFTMPSTFSAVYTAKNNYFGKSAEIQYQDGMGTHRFSCVQNPISSGIDMINSVTGIHTEFHTGFAGYQAVVNSQDQKAYFFSREDIGQSKLYMLDLTDYTLSVAGIHENGIGGCVYNPFQNHVVVSEYSPQGTSLYYYDEANIKTAIPGTEHTYGEELFVAPNGKLYMTHSMIYTGTTDQKVTIFDATDYSFQNEVTISYALGTGDVGTRMKANFTYFEKPADNGVYFIISPLVNSSVDISESTQNGKLYCINRFNTLALIMGFPVANTRQLVYCPVPERFFISSDDGLKWMNAGGPLFQTIDDEQSINGMAFDQETSTLFYCSQYYNSQQQVDGSKIWEVDCKATEPVISELGDFVDREVISLYFNEADRTLLAYILPDDLNPDRSVNIALRDIQAGVTTMVELPRDCQPDSRDEGYLYYQRNQFMYDNVTMKILAPNGMQSNLTYIQNEFEYMRINKGWNWISFPRLDQENSPVLARPILDSIDPFPTYLSMLNRPLQDPEPPTIDITYYYPEWFGELINVQSTYGYKLETNNPDNCILPLKGSILNPDTEITIYDGHENWVGYFLPETQSPFDAIPEDVLPHLRTITGQYWTCLNYAFITPPPKASANSIGEWRCLCNQGKVELEYNDMIIMILGNTTEQVFSWNRIGSSGTIIKKDAPEYFQYSEQPNYEAIIINLDSIDVPDEIGAFAGDSCIGATKVMPGDTSAMICAYTQGFEGEEISFELIYLTKASRPVIDNYLVFNDQTRINENGKIIIGEKQPFYLVSFSKNTEQIPLLNLPSIHCLPNPSSDEVTIRYFLPYESGVKICITNILGREMMCLDQQYQTAGEYQVTINTSWFPSGYYLVSLSARNQSSTNKMLIIH